jgi:hypothetical protein
MLAVTTPPAGASTQTECPPGVTPDSGDCTTTTTILVDASVVFAKHHVALIITVDDPFVTVKRYHNGVFQRTLFARNADGTFRVRSKQTKPGTYRFNICGSGAGAAGQVVTCVDRRFRLKPNGQKVHLAP